MRYFSKLCVLNKIVLAFLVVIGVTVLIGLNGLRNIETLAKLTSGIYFKK